MKRLSKKQMIVFAIGQLGWSMLSGIINAWFVTFYLPTQGDLEAGANQFVAGSYLFRQADMAAAVDALRKDCANAFNRP